jgi:hypothetical protein
MNMNIRIMMAIVWPLAASGMAKGDLLVDNFDGNNPTPTDMNFNLANRQAGSSLGTVTWTTGSGNVQQGSTVMANTLLVAGNGASASGLVSPDHVFNGAESAVGLVIEFDLDPRSAWFGINLGMSAANRWTGANQATSHLGAIVFPTGGIAIYDGATAVGSFTSAAVANTFTKVAFRLTDSIDGNPLDGAGETTLSIFVGNDPSPAFTYTKTGGGLSGGYINFQASPGGLGLVDNFRIFALAGAPATVSIDTYPGLTITGTRGAIYGIQSTTTPDIADSWQNTANVTLANPTQIWHDTRPLSDSPRRFYRVVAGQIPLP